jgi:peptide/nickel transport system substrate-binding protein
MRRLIPQKRDTGSNRRTKTMEMFRNLADLTIQGQLSRRAFMERAMAFGIGIPLATTLLAEAALAAPKKGGHLAMALQGGATTDSLDPTTYQSQVPAEVGFLFGSCLVEMTPAGEPSSELAESWEASDNAKKWVFKLRKGVQFHNGKEMTAADVVFSLNRHRGPDSKSGAAGQMKIISDIKATDNHEITVTLSDGTADLPYMMSDYHLLIQPEGDKGDSGIGTGGYVIKTFDPGVRIVAERNPNYFKSDRAAWADTVEFLVVNDSTARISAFQSGKVQLINRVEPKIVGMLKHAPGLKVVNTPGRGQYLFLMRCDKPPYDNADLRLALKYATDREQILKQCLLGYGSIGNDQPINAAYPFFAADIPQYHLDLDKAKFHAKKSGFDGTIVLDTADVAFTGAVDAATLLQASAAKAGIKIEVKRDPGDGYWDNIWNKAPFSASYWGGRPTPDQMLSIAYLSDAPWNDTAWHRPAFDKIVAEARSELDTAKRKALYREAQLMIHDDGGSLIPMFNDFLDGVSDKVGGFVKDPYGEMSGLRAAERCYFV